jgi:hypothetical protein
LNEWSFDNIKEYYKLSENRSQVNSNNQPYFDPSITPGNLGGFSPEYYGLNGYIPLLFKKSPLALDFLNAVNTAVTNTVNQPNGPFDYPLNIDLDYPPNASLGGTSIYNISATDQFGSLIPPNENYYVPFPVYNHPLYNDNGFTVPPEFEEKLNNPIPVVNPEGIDTLPYYSPLSGLTPIQRVSAANSYLYPALDRNNLTVFSEALVSKIIFEDSSNLKAIGVEYLEGWNIYQTGRNPDVGTGGFGGTPGDAKYNAHFAKQNVKKVYANNKISNIIGIFF